MPHMFPVSAPHKPPRSGGFNSRPFSSPCYAITLTQGGWWIAKHPADLHDDHRKEHRYHDSPCRGSKSVEFHGRDC